ncbi:carbohydrate-binding family 9-like protein [candidate division KSB1 bacterium]|nr:carbohydrate-binding family 9-like protein [candidate division KSB1 bacterium]
MQNKTMPVILLMSFIVLLIFQRCTSRDNDSIPPDSTPEYVCNKIQRDIVLTGKIDDPFWAKASPVTLVDAASGKPGRFQTEVRLLYNDTYLYVAFRCEDDYVWGTVTERDGPVYTEECVEVFVNPASLFHQYYEINVSPKGVIFDASLLNSRTPENPKAKYIPLWQLNLVDLQIKIFVDGETDHPGRARGWSAEYAIPFAELWGAPNVPPKDGDLWRINFYRIDTPENEQMEFYAWSVLGIADFHRPWDFGHLKFKSQD